MRSVRSLGFFLPLLIVFLMQVSIRNAAAQTNRASITGTVTDSTGAVVAGAEVTATNTGTSVPTKTVSNGDGIYVIPNLFPGQYSVEFKKDGFETLLRPAITLESTEVARLDAALKVGAVAQTVTVTADAPVMDTERASEGTNMKGSVIEGLPLSIYDGGRFVEDFAVALTPGYSVYSNPYGAVVNGGQWFTKDYTVDGTSGSASYQGNSMSEGPAMEAVQEVEAQTSGLDAQSSITGGGVIAMNLKSGTNQFHGSAFLYGHNELLDANTWNNDYFGEEKPKKRAWDYGFSLGGPIYKNKTFFFGTFERFTQVDWRLAGGSQTVPTLKMLGLAPGSTGADFSELLGAVIPGSMVYNEAGQLIPAQVNMIYDPNPPAGVCPNPPCQFTNNVIPTSRLSLTSQKIAAIYKQYYAPQYGGVDNNARGLLATTPTQTPNQFVVKLDHVLREQDRVSASWIYNHKPSLLDDSGGIWQQGTQNGGPFSDARNILFYNHQVRLSESHTFTPRVLNVLNFTYNMDYQNAAPTDPGNWSSQLGFGNTGANTFPFLDFNDQNAYYGHTESYVGSVWQGNFSGVNVITGDALTWTKGRHNLTFGGDFTARQINSRSGSGALSFDFPFYYTSGPGYPYDGFSFASFMLGMADRASESVAHNLYGRQKELDLFAQDNYKVSSKLTLSMGLRWNYNFRFHEKYGNWANYDLNAINPNYSAPGLLTFAKNGGDSFEKNEYAKNFGPSFGFAYALKPKTVFRGSFGLIYNPPGLDFSEGVPNAFAPQLGINQTGAIANWDNGYPGTVTKPDANTPPTDPSLFPVTYTDPRALRVGYIEQFNFGIQQELTPNTRLEISYVGNRGHRLTDSSLAWNEGPSSTFQRLGQQGLLNPSAPTWVCDPATAAQYGVPYPSGNQYVYGNFCGPVLAAIAPSPQLADADTNYWGYDSLLYAGLPRGQSFYDSMVVDVVKRTGRGLTMDMSYTWSRQEGDSFSSQQGGNGYYTGVQDFSNMRQAAHAITGYDLAHVVKGFVSYELPFGKGRQWFNGGGRVANAIASGWTTTGVVEYNSGAPFAVSASNPYWPLWGDIYPQFNLAGYTGPNTTKHFVPLPANWQGAPPASNIYMPSTVASNPAAGVLPPSPATSALRCPGQANEDVSVLKNFAMGGEGQYRLQLRGEYYNLFNRHYYLVQGCDSLRSDVGASNFGEILSVMDNPRNAQFGIRFEF
ncbi:MAG: carboxypeptidase regulatory-like domain-containing protein [Terriglobales bacterium]